MGSNFIVPSEILCQFQLKLIELQGHNDSSCALVLERKDESLNDGNRAMLPDGAKSRFDAASRAPVSIFFAELRPLVGDEVLGILPNGLDDTIEPVGDITGSRPILEFAGRYRFAREVIDQDSHAIGEWPALKATERKPRHPEAEVRGYYR